MNGSWQEGNDESLGDRPIASRTLAHPAEGCSAEAVRLPIVARGCGRTLSVWIAEKIRRLSLTTRTLWTFLQHAVVGTMTAAIRAANCQRSDRTFQRIWKRFNRGQSAIRTALLGRGLPPELAPRRGRWETQRTTLPATAAG